MFGRKPPKPTIGWREWVSLPSVGIKKIKAKVDTGAQTSAMHAYDVEFYRKAGHEFVKFKVHPEQRSTKKSSACRARVVDYRKVKSSNGQSELRPVIISDIELMDQKWPIEITLTNRDEMGFRMLLGREAFKKRFLVDAGNSFFGEKMKKKAKKK
ncbi:MAG: ATP-dependent zinc protease [Bdellovibrionales bacterium]|nr:ATP-dependent zinc protease [Bdellovibrionales bacterium]